MSHTLLLADDSVTIQRVIELTFADEDVNVVAVSDGDEAIAVLDRTPPDIVLADVGMPGRSGYEVAQHIRDTPRLAHIPVVLLTGAFEPIDQAKATAAGCDGVLAKPFEPQLVIGRVKELLAKPRQAASLDAPLPPPPAAVPPWAAPLTDSEPFHAAASSREAGDYFERLDQAFANLSSAPDTVRSGPSSSPPGATALDWFASQPPPAGTVQSAVAASTLPDRWDAPTATAVPPPSLSYASPPPPPAFDPTPPRPFDTAQGRPFDGTQGRHYDVPPSRPPVPPPPTLPPLADAFAALLAAEQASPTPSAAPLWPSLPRAAAPTTVSEDVIEQVTRRVLDQLTDRVLSEALEEKVSQIAERLIREEIERIKASIQ